MIVWEKFTIESIRGTVDNNEYPAYLIIDLPHHKNVTLWFYKTEESAAETIESVYSEEHTDHRKKLNKNIDYLKEIAKSHQRKIKISNII